ncbi:hypothetical protein D3C87_314380 [compost metagenome]
MRILLRSFVFLDLLSLLFMTMQLWSVFQNFSQFTLLSDKIQGVLMFPMYALVLLGAYGLFFEKKLGFISYYIQFPFRLYLWVFTLGFITLLPEALSNYDDKWFPVLLKVCFAAEFIRLYLTIRANIAAKQEG